MSSDVLRGEPEQISWTDSEPAMLKARLRHGLKRRLADEYALELVWDTPLRRLIFWSTTVPPGTWLDARHHLSDDGLHPNDNGAKFLAETVAPALERVYGRNMLKH